ncbi:MAG: glycosyltransferase, partial [Janthinobacterium lividum]
SFISWAAAENLYVCRNQQRFDGGASLKRQMVRAAIAGADAIWRVTPHARLLQCEPLIKVAAPAGDAALTQRAHDITQSQFEAWDMLAGLQEPELGGAARYLDMLGVNYYHNNQWQLDEPLEWHLRDARRTPLHGLLVEVCARYQRSILLAETSHVGSGRGAWIMDVANEVALATTQGARIDGICLYPIIDRPDWDDGARWHRSGLWAVDHLGSFARSIAPVYQTGVRNAQRALDNFFQTFDLQLHHTINHDTQPEADRPMDTIIVFSHLRWDFVYQRPQHLLSRLAQHYRIVFIEEPVHDAGAPFLDISTPCANVLVGRPHTPSQFPGFHDEQLPYLKTMVAELGREYPDALVWFYTPMALPLLDALSPSVVVYDCMDELAAFKNSPRQLLQREGALLNTADIVFAGGPSLYRSKKDRHPNVHCFSSSVDVVHFAQALDRSNYHPEQENIPTPRLGFYGVIDERFDAPLIGAVADAHPEWQIVLVGPVVKIDPATLPRRDNIHYLGQQNYASLPHFLAGWDLCLMPFALNESTRFISPTKTLEYLAAELPIVSTPIADVIELYGDVVSIAADQAAFISACERALAQTAAERAAALPAMRETLAKTSWEATAEGMRVLLAQAQAAFASRQAQAAGSAAAPGQIGNELQAAVMANQAAKANQAGHAAINTAVVHALPANETRINL